VVTGASSGIGRQAAIHLAQRGVSLALGGRSEERLKETASLCEEKGVSCISVAGDACDENVMRKLTQAARELSGNGRVGAALSAGVARFGETERYSRQDWDETLNANLSAVFVAARELIPIFRDQGGGRALVVLSIASKVAFPQSAAYVASKFGALGLVKSLQAEYRREGIEWIAFLPGSTWTELWERMDSPLERNRMLKAEDVGRTIADLILHPGDGFLDEVVYLPKEGIL
jgi:short-subunit dehydrogenase